MERIDTQYGREVNYLRLTKEEMKTLEPFLVKLGVRMRWMSCYQGVFEVQAENPYKCWIGSDERKFADEDMSEKSRERYNR